MTPTRTTQSPTDALVGPRLAQLPNAITASRVLIAIAFVAVMSLPSAMAGQGAPWGDGDRTLVAVGLALFLLAAISDALDGYLARRWRVVSVLGRIMDPFADKILVLGAFVLLAGPQFALAMVEPNWGSGEIGGIPARPTQITGVAPWMVVVILARDLLVTTLRGLVEGRGRSFAALPAGKIKMIVQSVGVPVILLTLAIADDPTRDWARWTVRASAWGVTLLTAWSAIPYALDGWRKLREP